MLILKQYARREVAGYISPYEDPFTYRTMKELGRMKFVEAFALVSEGSAGRDRKNYPSIPEIGLQGLIDFANSAFNPLDWKLAFLNGDLAGMVLPTQYYDDPEEGSLFHFGLTPEFRGKGYARILHAKGLQDLAEMGILRYVGSTDVENKAMIQVFLQNGCALTSIREQEVLD